MSVDYFDEQRRQMVAAIRASTGHVAAQIGKGALDRRVLQAMAKVARHEFVPVEVQTTQPRPKWDGTSISGNWPATRP